MRKKGILLVSPYNEKKVGESELGSPEKKYYLKEMMKALSNLSAIYQRRIEFNVFGVNSAQLIDNCLITKDTISKCGSNLIIHGEVSREIVFQFLKKADFTVLLRFPVLRYAKAAFPTKVVESLASGTPMICNHLLKRINL